MSLTKERSSYLDNVKSILIFFVVIGHFAESALEQSDVFKSMFLWLYFFHMPLFIFVTGYLSKRLIQNKERVVKKSFEYFTLYVIMKITLSVARFIFDGGKVKFSLLSETSVPWYLLAIAIMYLVSYALRNYNQKVILGFCVILALFVGYDSDIRDFLVLSRVIVFYPFFMLGLMCQENTLEKIKSKKVLLPGAVLVLLLSILIFYMFPDDIYEFRPLLTARNPYKSLNAPFEEYGPLCRLLVYGVGSLLGFSILIITPNKKLGYFSKIGERTLPIFFFHRQVLWALDGIGIYDKMQDSLGSLAGNCIWLFMGVMLTLILSISIFTKPFGYWNKLLFRNNN